MSAYVLNLRLDDPASAQAFASRYDAGQPGSTPSARYRDRVAGHRGRGRPAGPGRAAASWSPGAWLLGLLAVASVAVLVGGRMAEHTRRIGLLKAVGATPGLVAAVLLAENLVLALTAAAAGLVGRMAGRPAAHQPGAALVGTPGAPSLTLSIAAEVVGVALAVALAATLVPALRAARTSTVARAGRRGPPAAAPGAADHDLRAAAGAAAARAAAGRPPAAPRRCSAPPASRSPSAGIVAVLAFHATAGEQRFGGTSGLVNPVASRDEQMLLVVTVMLLTLAAAQRDLHRLGDHARRQARLGAGPRARRHARGRSAPGWRPPSCSPRCPVPSSASRWASACSPSRTEAGW